MAPFEPLTKEKRAQDNRRDRDEERDKQQIRRACRGQEAEIEHLGQRGRYGETWCRQRPGVIDQKSHGQQHKRRSGDLSRRRHYGWDSHALEAPPEHARKGVGQGRGQHSALCDDVGPQAHQHRWADENGNTGEADENADEAVGGHPFVGRQTVRNNHGGKWRRGVEDCRKPARDTRLAPHNEAEWHGVVEQPHAEERGPGPSIARHLQPEHWSDEVEDQGGEPAAQHNQGDGGSSRSATPMKKNEPPQRAESARSMPHSEGRML